MAENPESGSKTEAPSQKRLSDARARGDVPRSSDVSSAASLLGASLVLLLAGGPAARQMVRDLTPLLEHPDAFDVSAGGLSGVSRAALAAMGPGFWVLGGAAGAAVFASMLQQGFIWAPERLSPDLSRLNPLEGLKRVYGLDGLFAFVRSALKLAAIAAVAVMVLRPKAQLLENLSSLNVVGILPFSMELFRALLIAVLIVLSIIAAADYAWQRIRWFERLKMTRDELKEDTRQSEGDPHVRAKIRQLRFRRARTRMIQQVPKATVVVMNPTHYAIALRYVQGETAAPVCVAKGVDELALKIREVARAHEVPVVEDPPLARALYAAMDVDEAIPRQHYEAVAKVIGFVLGRARPAARARPLGR